jgi:predicted enzyme related to lactoylglutathione lyase
MQNEPKVIGVGGVFFKSANPKESRAWYETHLGFVINEHGATFTSRNADNPEEMNSLQWSPFSKDTEYFLPSEKEFMVNFRVQHIEALVKKLQEAKVTVLDDIQSYEGLGKFVHILDAEGNKIELWEQAIS